VGHARDALGGRAARRGVPMIVAGVLMFLLGIIVYLYTELQHARDKLAKSQELNASLVRCVEAAMAYDESCRDLDDDEDSIDAMIQDIPDQLRKFRES
jgi:Tfp pilus assembly protein PilO